jgi:hypothetical protein
MAQNPVTKKISDSIEVARIRTQMKVLEAQLSDAEDKLRRTIAGHPVVRVSDHAIVRYLERVLRIDIDHVRGCILTEQVKLLHKQLGDGIYPSGKDDVEVVIKDKTIVTIIKAKDSSCSSRKIK